MKGLADRNLEAAAAAAEALGALGGEADALPAALASYQSQRLLRTAQVQTASYVTAEVLHLPDGTEAVHRDEHLASAAWVHGQLDWIHSYNADPDFAKVVHA